MSVQTSIPNYQEGLTELRGNLEQMLPNKVLSIFDTDAGQLQATHKDPLKVSVGDQAPRFVLSNATNQSVALENLIETGKVVLTFYRGNWCPYCNLQLAQLQQILPEIKQAGAHLVAISPQTPDQSLSMKQKNELEFEVLSDNGNLVAEQYTTVFINGEVPIETMTELGINFHSHYADDSGQLPVPAVFVIEQDGTISFAQSMGGDYRNRVEPQMILEALRS